MEGAIGQDIVDHETLRTQVHEELIGLRGQLGKLTVQKFSQYPMLRRVCGGNDLLDAFLMFEREMARYQNGEGRDEAAAAISITAAADTVLDRLEHAVGALPQDGKLRDQRTARRWSDAGLKTIATELVYLADVQGRLGTELLSIEVHGDREDGLEVIIDQMTSAGLPERAPRIRLWRYRSEDEPEERSVSFDLDEHPSTVAAKREYVMKRHRLLVEFPPTSQTVGNNKVLGVSIEGRDAPMRTVFFEDHSHLPDELRIQFSVYRTIAMIEVIDVQDPVL